MYRNIAIAAVLAVVALAAAAMARPHGDKKTFVADVANRTMCPIRVEIDDRPDRVPRRIKFLRCAEHPERVCEQHRLAHGCCRRHHHNYVTECVELYDWVQVIYEGQSAPSAISVPVGCTCLIQESTTPSELQ